MEPRFHRPTDELIFRLLGRFMPPPPENQEVFSYPPLKHFAGWREYLICLPFCFLMMGALWSSYQEWGFLTLSIALLFFQMFIWAYHMGMIWLAGVIVAFFTVDSVLSKQFPTSDDARGSASSMGQTPGRLAVLAVFEEQWFREGSEKWGRIQRLKSSVVFALTHLRMLIYPLAWIIALPFFALVLMGIYLRELKKTDDRYAAVRKAAVYHWIFNRIMLTVFVLSFGSTILYQLFRLAQKIT